MRTLLDATFGARPTIISLAPSSVMAKAVALAQASGPGERTSRLSRAVRARVATAAYPGRPIEICRREAGRVPQFLAGDHLGKTREVSALSGD
jgi:hypothetical protein